MIHCIVDAASAGTRLDVFLVSQDLKIPSRSFAAKLILAGSVTVNLKKVKPSQNLNTGDRVEFDDVVFDVRSTLIENVDPTPEKIELDILFEDDDILVINKQSGMVVHPGAGVNSGTLVHAVLAHCGQTLPSLGGKERAGIVHRLDKETSGVMVVAKTQLALTELAKQFSRHEQIRKYQALVFNVPEPLNETLENWLVRDPRCRTRYACGEEGVGKWARLKYQVLEQFANADSSHVEFELYTGRTHQIRVQSLEKKTPLIGDKLYTLPHTKMMKTTQRFAFVTSLASRQMLHACILVLRHPRHATILSFSSPLPADFLKVLDFLRKS